MFNLSFQFLDSTTDLTTSVQGRFNPILVVLSLAIAGLASYTALLIAERVHASENRRIRYAWLGAGAFAMGTGIWAMHFVGMLAFKLPMTVNYNLFLTCMSILPAILASSAALHFLNASEISFWRMTLGGLLMAVGIGTMHFLGMAGMVMDAELLYDPALFMISIAFAHLLATFGLYSKFVPVNHHWITGAQRNFVSALAMGSSICAMHYTAMSSAHFIPGEVSLVEIIAISEYVLAFATTMATGLILGVLILATIIDRRLQEANGLVHLILDSVEEGIFGIDREGFITFINPAGAKLIGWKKEKLIGQSQYVIIHHTHLAGAPEESPIYATMTKGDMPYGRNEIFWRKDGSTFPVECAHTLIQSTNKENTEAVVTFRDLTNQQKRELQLRQSQKLESIGQLAAGIAHEINTPIQFISDNLRFLTDSFHEVQKVLEAYAHLVCALPPDAVDPQRLQEMAATLAEADLPYVTAEIPKALHQSLDGAERVANIVRAMKDFSHPGSTAKTLYDVNKAIESTITVAHNEWKYVAEMVTQFDPALPLVSCLPGEFNQVILNLLVNAAHAIEAVVGKAEGGKGTITVTTRMQNDGVEIRIADTGTGIPENARHKIFDPFFTTKEVGKGTGQGLAIAHDVIVKKHGGRLTFETEVGTGTTFIIQVPSRPEHQVKGHDEITHLVGG